MTKLTIDGDVRRNAKGLNRRHFLQTAGFAAALVISRTGSAADSAGGVSIIVEPGDSVADSSPAQWAIGELSEALTSRSIVVRRLKRLAQAAAGELCIVAAGPDSPMASQILAETGARIPKVPEALCLVPLKISGKQVLLACGRDERGLVYALLELADRVRHGTQPLVSLNLPKPVVEQPANAVRSLSRLFVSEIEDKPWYNDRRMWLAYLTMLATQRFNRFNLAMGIGYDFLRNVTDGYFLFAYPFLLSVPGYNVRVPELPDAERDQNLDMLRFISEQTVARGIQFQLGLWMHGYQWINSPNANYTIAGLSRENHGPYCREAVLALLKACPAISGVTFRIHGESGVAEGSYDFWRTVFEGVAKCGRKVEIDMHAKGMDQDMIDLALATSMPVNISPKYWAEHLGMPYHQAEIRELERPKPGREGSGLMKLSSGSRSFLRYGYGDLLREDRRYGVVHRIWPGTQRLLLWGDPVTGAAHARAFNFCGSAGVEIMEPLSFKGRRGSGIAGDRCGYADASLKPRWDWEKYLYSLRVWGRLLYNPESDPDVWRRYLEKQFGSGAEAVESALASASRILPIITTAHGASAANNNYWPEMYTNQPIVDPGRKHPYSDSPAPKLFGNVSPFDPQLFLRINDYAGELLNKDPSGKYTPIEVAQWIEDYADEAAKHLAQAESQADDKRQPEFRRMAADVAIQVGLGRFFAAKFRCGVLYAIFIQSGDRTALDEALKAYRRARITWAELAGRAKDVYKPDVTVGELTHLRGHWLDRLPAMDDDIADMAKLLDLTKNNDPEDHVRLAIQAALGRPQRASVSCRHVQPEQFRPGQPLEIVLSLEKTSVSARLFYRHVNQAERYEVLEMQGQGNRYRAVIPAAYTNSPYPIQYYFELKDGQETARLYPGIAADLANQPYFVVRQIQVAM
jgi:hypothetical protein